MKNFKSEISFWCNNENIETIPTISVPIVGEEIYINNKTDELWYDNNFKSRKLFNPGVRCLYKVVSVSRTIKSYDIKTIEKMGESDLYEFPSKNTTEIFDVMLKEIK